MKNAVQVTIERETNRLEFDSMNRSFNHPVVYSKSAKNQFDLAQEVLSWKNIKLENLEKS